jgi:hypothetical protein
MIKDKKVEQYVDTKINGKHGDSYLFNIDNIPVIMSQGMPDSMFYRKSDENKLAKIAKENN